MSIPAGTFLGPYEVMSLLGSGGMAEVYRARDARLGRDVAVKVLPRVFADDREALMRFEHEARSASALNHPHLVTIHDIGETMIGGERVPYIAMELIRGSTLRHRMNGDDCDTLLRHLANVAEGLAGAHEHGIIHRDLKPENVMISEDGFAKVVDFGLAKRIPIGAATAPYDPRLTREGMVVGTLGYMAPEQLAGGRDLDQRVDVFAFGCMLYEAVAKRPAFHGDTSVDVMHNILHDEPPPLPLPSLDRIVRRCLAKNREQRYSSMRDVAKDVREAIQPASSYASPPRRNPHRWAATAVIAAIAVFVAAFAMKRATHRDLQSIAVLPFSASPDVGFLGDGMADEIVHDLSRIHDLRVIASSSTARYRHAKNPQAAARELNVDAVLVGTMTTHTGTLSFDARLVRAANGVSIWSGNYARPLQDAAALERQVVRDLCERAGLKLVPSRVPTANAEAYAAYQRGREAFQQQTAPSLKTAIEYFHKAIALVPDYAEAWAALAAAHGRQAVLGLVPTRETVEQEKGEVAKALALDDTLADAHFQLAMIANVNRDDATYDRELGRTLQLDPNYARAWLDRANHLLRQKKFDEADALYQRARSLDPMSPAVMSSYGVHLFLARQYDRAASILFNETEQFPEYVNGVANLAIVYSYMGRNADAIAEIERANPALNSNFLVWKGVVLARAGRTAEARAIAAQADDAARGRFVPPFYRAMLRAELGERDAALTLLEEAKHKGDWEIERLPNHPGFDSLRSNPRFAALLR